MKNEIRIADAQRVYDTIRASIHLAPFRGQAVSLPVLNLSQDIGSESATIEDVCRYIAGEIGKL